MLGYGYKERLDWDKHCLTYKQLESHVGLRGELIWGFVDGTMKVIYRLQGAKKWYLGYEKRHAIKSQAIATPDGLISHLVFLMPIMLLVVILVVLLLDMSLC